jgi:hypothetical protein
MTSLETSYTKNVANELRFEKQGGGWVEPSPGPGTLPGAHHSGKWWLPEADLLADQETRE